MGMHDPPLLEASGAKKVFTNVAAALRGGAPTSHARLGPFLKTLPTMLCPQTPSMYSLPAVAFEKRDKIVEENGTVPSAQNEERRNEKSIRQNSFWQSRDFLHCRG